MFIFHDWFKYFGSKGPLKNVSEVSNFRLPPKVTEQIRNNAKKKLDDRAKLPVSKTSFKRNKKFSNTFLLLTHESHIT